MNPSHRLKPLARIAAFGLLIPITPLAMTEARAQITSPVILSGERDRYATLQDQLLNRLRATRDDQQAYINYIVEQVRLEKLEAGLVIAIERYAMRRNPQYPFPFFERALRYESAKRGVNLTSM